MKSKKSRSLLQLEITAKARLPFSKRRLERFLNSLFRALKISTAQLSLAFMKDAAMARWHMRWMGEKGTTDCLSLEYSGSRRERSMGFAGDVAVCLDEAKRRSKELGIRYSEELARYVIHGILHCLGHDDQTPSKRARMWRLQEHLLSRYKNILTPNP